MIYIDKDKTYDFSAHKMPVFYEKKNVEYLLWGYCEQTYKDPESKQWDNLQPDYYEWLYNSSSKHRSIINRKTLFINGKGLKGDFKHLQPEAKAELGAFVFGVNHSEIIKNWSLNLTKIGGFCYEVIPQKNGKKIDIHYVNLKNIRRSVPSYDTDGKEEPVKYYYTRNWKARKPEENPDFTTFHEWDYTDNFDRNKRYLVLYSEDQENLYPIPEYTAAVPYIAADYEIGNFTYNNTKNGFAASVLINFFNGDLQDDQKAEIVEQVKAKLHGTDNSGEPIVSFQDIDVPGVEIIPISANGQDDRFINLNKQVREEIFAGHTVNPIVVGLEGANGFNNNADEERTATEHFKKYYIQGKQMIIEKHLNAVRMFNGIQGDVFIQDLDPIEEQVTEAELTQILTMEERRERAGYEPLDIDTNATTEALGALSPLLATKVLETMSASEIRELVGLSTPDTGVERVTETVIEQRYSKEDDEKILAFLTEGGINDDELEVIDERVLFASNISDAQEQGLTFIRETFNSIDSDVLNLLSAGNMSIGDIAKTLGVSEAQVQDSINNLQDSGRLTEGNEPTEAPPETFIVYKYAKRPDAKGESILPTTRDFCKRLVQQSGFKSWTLEEIKRMNNNQGLDVFFSRGGWYNDNGTPRPYCRHIWKQLLVRRKNG